MTVPKYLISRLLLSILVLLAFMATAKPLLNPSDCDQFNVKVTVNQTNQVVVEVSGLKGKQILHVIGSRGFSKQNVSLDQLNSLGKGSYVLIVIDQEDSENYCQKHFDFTIK